MGIVNKYKVNELAKDFGMQTKQIIEILGKYFPTPKKSGQNLDEKELRVFLAISSWRRRIFSASSCLRLLEKDIWPRFLLPALRNFSLL